MAIPVTDTPATDALATREPPVKVAAAAPRDVTIETAPEDAAADLTKRADRGSYTVSGLGNRKKAILGAGGNTLDLAIAMLETEKISTGYIYGSWSYLSFPLTVVPLASRQKYRELTDTATHRWWQDLRCHQLRPLQAELGHAAGLCLALRLQGPKPEQLEQRQPAQIGLPAPFHPRNHPKPRVFLTNSAPNRAS